MKFTKKVKFYTLNKGDKFWDYAWGGHYHQFVRCEDIEEENGEIWNAVDLNTGDFFRLDFDDTVKVSIFRKRR